MQVLHKADYTTAPYEHNKSYIGRRSRVLELGT
jgi:hypothetical protein